MWLGRWGPLRALLAFGASVAGIRIQLVERAAGIRLTFRHRGQRIENGGVRYSARVRPQTQRGRVIVFQLAARPGLP